MQFSLRSKGGLLLSFLILVALAGAFLLGGTLVQRSPASAAGPVKIVVKFALVPSPGITAC